MQKTELNQKRKDAYLELISEFQKDVDSLHEKANKTTILKLEDIISHLSAANELIQEL